MATSGELAETLSRTLGIPRGTVNFYGQALRNAGLLTTGGRGLSAVRMTDKDAIHWLVALCVSDSARAAPELVQTTLAARCAQYHISPNDAQTSDYLFARATRVADLLTALLADSRKGRLHRTVLDIVFRRNVPEVRIVATRHDELSAERLWTLAMNFSAPPRVVRRVADGLLLTADAKQNFSIGNQTIRKIAERIRDKCEIQPQKVM